MKDIVSPYRSIRRTEYALLLFAIALLSTGAVTETIWLLGIGAWALIGAGLVEMIYRP